MIEQRITARMTTYWERLKGDRNLPQIEHFNTAVIQDLWPNCMRIGVFSSAGAGTHYSYEYIGEELTKALGGAITVGMRATSKMGFLPAAKILARIDTVLADPQPVIEEGQFINDKNKIVKYRCCLLPFGNETTVTDFIVGVSWRTF